MSSLQTSYKLNLKRKNCEEDIERNLQVKKLVLAEKLTDVEEF